MIKLIVFCIVVALLVVATSFALTLSGSITVDEYHRAVRITGRILLFVLAVCAIIWGLKELLALPGMFVDMLESIQ